MRNAPAASEDARLLADVGSAAGLCRRRRGAAASLTVAVATVLEELGFPPGVFEVAIGRRPAGPGEAAVEVDGDAVAFDGSGIDQVVYQLAPNPGEPARPLAKIASGGECHGSRWRSSASSPRPTRRPRSSSTRSTPGSVAAAPIRSGARYGASRAVIRSCA